MANPKVTPDPSLDPVFRPRSIAVVGASRRAGSIGHAILANLIRGDFAGPVYPVHPTETSLQTLKCYPSVEAIPDPVDLAVIAIPRDGVLEVAEACARRGVRGLVVVTAGFKEVGGAGIAREERLRAIVRGAGMRMIGPNCMGILNTDPEVRMNASFGATAAIPGEVALMTQSGALGEVILAHAASMGVGFSMFASMGNKTDVSGNDLLQYWEHDPRTKLILLYLESFGNPRRFSELARRITRTKPILAVKSGRTAAGARAATSHTGALAGSDVATDALFEQCGVVRIDSVPEMFELALAMTTQPAPRGRRVAIVTNAGGPGILAADACASRGLALPELGEATRRTLEAELPEECSLANPVDLLANAGPERYEIALGAVMADPGIDAVLVIFVPPVMIDAPRVAHVIHEAASRRRDLPLLGCFMGQQRSFPHLQAEFGERVPFYAYPEEAVRCLDRMARAEELRVREQGRAFDTAIDVAAVDGVLSAARAQGRAELYLSESLMLAEAAGMAVAPWKAVGFEEGPLRAAARELPRPWVLKADVPARVHKMERGLVALGLDDEQALERAARRMLEIARAEDVGAVGWVVQSEVPRGSEWLLGMVHDPVFGPLIAVGFGGTEVEAHRDVVFRLNPVTDAQARAMVRSLRGEAGVEADASLGPVLARIGLLSRLIEAIPDLAELDWNPVAFGLGGLGAGASTRAEASGGVLLDARVRLLEGGP